MIPRGKLKTNSARSDAIHTIVYLPDPSLLSTINVHPLIREIPENS
jgi:hypothetical protein